MRKFILIGLIVTGPTWAQASGLIELDMNARANIHIYHHGDSKGGLDCRGGSNGIYANTSKDVNNDGKLSTQTSAEKSVPVQTGYFKSNSGYGFNDLTLFQLNLSGKSEQKNNTTHLSASIVEATTETLDRHWGSGCSNDHYEENLKNASYSGLVKLTYTVPQNVWAVKVSEDPYNRVFKAESALNKGAINGALYETKLIGERIIWVTPGSQLTKAFQISATANQKFPSNTYDMTYTTLGNELSAGEMNNEWVDSFVDGLSRTMNPEETAAMSKDDLFYILQQGFSILRSKQAFTESLKALSTQSLFEMTQKLHRVAMGEILAPDAESKVSIRNLAALISYEVASLLIEDFAPFCALTEHDLPYTGETAQISDLQWGVYLMNRMIGRLETTNPELGIFGAYEEFLAYLYLLEEKNLSYKDIYDPETLKKAGLFVDMDQRLKLAFQTVRSTSHPQSRPIARSFQDLIDFYSVYETLGTNDQLTEKVLTSMESLALMEDSFVKGLMKSIRHFSKDNTAKVDLSSVREEISQMKNQLNDVLKIMNNNVRLLSISKGSGSDSLVEILTELRVHSLNIVKNQYSNFQSDSGFDFETIRKQYVDQNRANKNLKTVQLCLGQGGAK